MFISIAPLHQHQLILYLDLVITQTVGQNLSKPNLLECSIITVADLLSKLFVEIFFGQETDITSGQITLCHIQQ